MKLDTKKILLIIGLIFLVALVLVLKFKNTHKLGKVVKLETTQSDSLDISGAWEMEIVNPPPATENAFYSITFKQNKNSLIGTFVPKVDNSSPDFKLKSKIVRGEIRNGNLNFLMLIQNFPLLECRGEISSTLKELAGACKFNTGLGFFNQPDRAWNAKKSD